MRFGIVTRSLMVAALTIGVVSAADESREMLGIKDVRLGGYGFWQFGQLVQFRNKIGNTGFPDSLPAQWFSGAVIGLNVDARPSERLRVLISPEFKLYNPTIEEPNNNKSVQPQNRGYLNDAQGIFSFGNVEEPYLKLALGMFSYKYNPDVRNLGEFLFRTGTYPLYVINNFDFPKTRLLGLKVGSDAVSNLHWDVMLTTEYEYYPLYDFSLAGIADYRIFDAIEIGAGVNFARLFPVNKGKTSPQISRDMGYGEEFTNQYIKSIDKIISTSNDTTYDTTYGFYSFQATKVMARASIDFKPFLASLFGFSTELFGKNDLRVYGEVTAVGVGGPQALDLPDTENPANGWYAYYNDLNRRTIRMIGVNIPAFSLLDIFAAEAEYFPSVLPNDYESVLAYRVPLPFIKSNDYSAENWDDGFWRWSVYARKEVINGFNFIGQIAFDHFRAVELDGSNKSSEALVRKGDWYWTVKVGYSF